MPNIPALIGSRICHDIINPLGAIGNGLELLELAGFQDSPELRLVSDSVAGAMAKVKFLRLAFGDATPDQIVARKDVLSTLQAIAMGGRLSYAWDVPDGQTRPDVRTAMLAIMCVESALPLGGDISITHTSDGWEVYTKNDRLNLDPALWAAMAKSKFPETLSGSQVHFALLPGMAAEAGRTLTMTHGADWVKINF